MFWFSISSGYLKLYQLSRPVLSGFDCLLIDEAQDCTPGKQAAHMHCGHLFDSFDDAGSESLLCSIHCRAMNTQTLNRF